MGARTRRGIVVSGLAIATGGCIGPDLGYEDDPPPPSEQSDDEQFERADLERITEFANASMAAIETAVATFGNWRDDPASADVDAIDQQRIEATGLWDAYWRVVAPYRDELAELERGTTLDGEEVRLDGDALAETLPDHEVLLDQIADAAVEIVDAEGDPTHVTGRGQNAVDVVLENGPRVIEATESALAESG